MSRSNLKVMSKEDIELRLSQVDLLMAMYPSDDELVVDTTTAKWFARLRDWSVDVAAVHNDEAISNVPSVLSFDLILDADNDSESGNARVDAQNVNKVQLSIDVPVKVESTRSDEQPQLKIRLRQPNWLSRAQTSQINVSIPPDCADDILATIDYLRDQAAVALQTTPETNPIATTTSTLAVPLVRVWFYFPSLSTRAKRADLVNYAPVYHLTGFVLAGKPGVLCLEGTSRNVDEYMKFIKTESWGDIPSHQKKVSERHREALGDDGGSKEGGRAFVGMQEITDADWMGEKRGERGNRNDLRALEGWLEGKGLKGVFEKVLM